MPGNKILVHNLNKVHPMSGNKIIVHDLNKVHPMPGNKIIVHDLNTTPVITLSHLSTTKSLAQNLFGAMLSMMHNINF